MLTDPSLIHIKVAVFISIVSTDFDFVLTWLLHCPVLDVNCYAAKLFGSDVAFINRSMDIDKYRSY